MISSFLLVISIVLTGCNNSNKEMEEMKNVPQFITVDENTNVNEEEQVEDRNELENNETQENNNQTQNSNVEKYEVTDYFYVTDEKKFLKGKPADIKNVKNNQRIYDNELANDFPNLYNVVKNIAYDWTEQAYTGQNKVDLSTYLYPKCYYYTSTGKKEYFFTLGQVYYDTDKDGFTDTLGVGYFIAPINELEQKYPDLVDYIKSELY